MRRVSSRLALFAVLALSVLGFAAVGAVAHTSAAKPKGKVVTITGGTTTIKANNATVTFLATHNVKPTAIAPATLTGTSLILPVKGGAVTSKSLVGAITHRGGVKFATAKKSFVLSRITLVKTGNKAHLMAKVGKRVLPLGTITGLKTAVSGKTATVTGELHLSKDVAAVINKLLGKHVVSAGYDFGSFTSTLTFK
jgi:hypothetical protein